MSKVSIALTLLLAWPVLPALGQTETQVPPHIEAIHFFHDGIPFSPQWSRGYFGVDQRNTASNPVLLEYEAVDVVLEVTDLNLPDETFEYFVEAEWIPYQGIYFTPHPPPMDGTTQVQRPITFITLGPITRVQISFSLVIPIFTGVNQAHLRGYIDWDVRWIIGVRIANPESGDLPLWDDVYFSLFAENNPALDTGNPPPFADAGADQTVVVGSTVQLDGGASFDASNVGFDPTDPNVLQQDPITYTWEWITGPQRVEPVYRDPLRPWLADVTLNWTGVYTYRLLVADTSGAMPGSDTVQITVVALSPVNHAPKAVIKGPTQPVVVGNVIMLDGTGSTDPDGDALHFRWQQTDAVGGTMPQNEFATAFQPLHGLESPVSTWQTLAPGTYYFLLVVDDGKESATASTSVQVIAAQSAGITVDNTLASQTSTESTAAGPNASSVLPGPTLCGFGLLPAALLPLVFWLMRGRIR
jgi:hypothetical protein